MFNTTQSRFVMCLMLVHFLLLVGKTPNIYKKSSIVPGSKEWPNKDELLPFKNILSIINRS